MEKQNITVSVAVLPSVLIYVKLYWRRDANQQPFEPDRKQFNKKQASHIDFFYFFNQTFIELISYLKVKIFKARPLLSGRFSEPRD